MSALGRGDQRGAAEAIGTAQVGTMGQGQFEDLLVAAGAGQQVGAVLHAVLQVDVGAGVHQPPRHLYPVGGGGQ
ncbi:hypothetical protein D9M71_798240 [compost metagenome]